MWLKNILILKTTLKWSSSSGGALIIKTNKKNKMKNGVVKFYNEAKGFGFIKEDNGTEIFVHATGLQEEIRENDNVVFDVQEGKKGLNAVNVKLA